jgi:hypothetical protein
LDFGFETGFGTRFTHGHASLHDGVRRFQVQTRQNKTKARQRKARQSKRRQAQDAPQKKNRKRKNRKKRKKKERERDRKKKGLQRHQKEFRQDTTTYRHTEVERYSIRLILSPEVNPLRYKKDE